MKHLITLTVLFSIATHAFAWSHSGSSRAASLRDNTESHYGGRDRVK